MYARVDRIDTIYFPRVSGIGLLIVAISLDGKTSIVSQQMNSSASSAEN